LFASYENDIILWDYKPVNLELLLNPLRLRIIHAVLDGRPFTTAQLSDRLADVSRATVYRQVAVLAEAGLLEIDGEERIRGAVERTYRLHSARAAMDLDTVAAMTVKDHQRLFTAAVGALLAEFNAYLGRQGADPLADSVSYRQFSLWLSEEEKAELVRNLTATLVALLKNGPSAERRQHMLSTILFPTDAA
jgi:DNA-binding transcriptional ArsR family regulator